MFSPDGNDNLTLGSARGDGSLVLLTENNATTRQMICSELEEFGFRVAVADDGADLLQRFTALQPDIVVIDNILPDSSGIEVCRTLRLSGHGAQVPILLTTKVPDPDVVSAAFEAGATDFLPLPFNWSLLPFRVSYLLRAHQVSRQLTDSEQRQHSLLDGIPDPLLVYGRDCRIQWANRSSASSLQKQRDDLVGKGCRDIWGHEQRACDNCEIARCFDAGEIVNGTRRSDDGRVWGVRLFPIRTDGGEIESVVKLAHDITDKINLQAEATRTGQLAAIGELAAGVAHEINNPIHGVINYAQILINRGTVDGSELDLVNRIQKEGGRVATIVENLLGFARPAAQNFRVEDVGVALDDAISLFSSKLKQDHIRLRVVKCDGPLLVRARKQQLQQVFINLISNGCYALNQKPDIDPHDKLLEIEMDRGCDSGEPVLVMRFIDHGCGISPDLLKRVLQPFVTTKPAGRGTGLGLSISETILREHGGRISIDSVQGSHTRVTLYLPLTG